MSVKDGMDTCLTSTSDPISSGTFHLDTLLLMLKNCLPLLLMFRLHLFHPGPRHLPGSESSFYIWGTYQYH